MKILLSIFVGFLFGLGIGLYFYYLERINSKYKDKIIERDKELRVQLEQQLKWNH